jgi:hypothetical protein
VIRATLENKVNRASRVFRESRVNLGKRVKPVNKVFRGRKARKARKVNRGNRVFRDPPERKEIKVTLVREGRRALREIPVLKVQLGKRVSQVSA